MGFGGKIRVFRLFPWQKPPKLNFALFGQEAGSIGQWGAIYWNTICGNQRDKTKIVAYMVCGNVYKEKAGQGKPVRQKKGIWKFSAIAEGKSPERHGARRSTILRLFTFARNMLRWSDGIRHNFGSDLENIHWLILCRLYARLGHVRICTLPAPFMQASRLNRDCFPKVVCRKQGNSTRTCPVDIFDNQSHGCPKRKGEKRVEARGGAKRFSGDFRAPVPCFLRFMGCRGG